MAIPDIFSLQKSKITILNIPNLQKSKCFTTILDYKFWVFRDSNSLERFIQVCNTFMLSSSVYKISNWLRMGMVGIYFILDNTYSGCSKSFFY